MEDELKKHSTDCVYFLASPFTCKKGAECEYRHSEMARLNPRDCWYWLSGQCLNPNCAFRHPPLEMHNEKPTEITVIEPNQSSVPATKSTVPCYFYYNGFCSKGGKCTFLHEPVNTFARKSNMGIAVSFASAPAFDSKTSVRSDSEPIQAGKHPSSSQMAMVSGNKLNVQQNLLPHKSAIRKVIDQTAWMQTNVPEYGELAAVKAVSLQREDYSPNAEYKSTLGSDRSSDYLIDGNVVQDEWCESSPGFDVLVDGQTVDMVYEDDSMYRYRHDEGDGDYKQVLMKHGPVDQIRYDERGFFSNRLCQESDFSDDELRADLRRYSPRQTRNQKVRRGVVRERKFCFGDSPPGGCNNMDLRDYLIKRKLADLYVDKHALRHDLVHTRDEGRGRVRRHAPIQRLHGRLPSKVERNGVQLGRRRTTLADSHQRGRLRRSQYDGYRRYNRFQRRPSSAEWQHKSYVKRKRDVPRTFNIVGPKSSFELKEDKRQGYHNKNGSVDFDGPKPLSEILKEKKKIST